MYGSNFCIVTVYPWPSSSAPIDAAARPLPSDDTTPPVTKMNLGVRPSMVLSGPAARTLRRSRRRHREQPAHLRQVLGGILLERFVPGFDGLDPDAVLERAQLLERLRAFERRRFERGEHQQGAAAIAVQADMSVHGRPAAARIAHVRDRRAREVHRVPAAIEHDL